jgi:hypothetical protein
MNDMNPDGRRIGQRHLTDSVAGWPCVQTEEGRIASGPEVLHITSPFTGERTSHVRVSD